MGVATLALSLGAIAVAGPRFERIAGSYGQSTGYQDASLVLRGDGTFERRFSNNDAGAPPREERGDAWLDGRTLTLTVADPARRSSWEKYVVVPWGERIFLVIPDQLRSFCMDFNKGSLEARFQPYYIRTGAVPAGALPDVPPQWREWLLPEGVVTRVTAHLEGGDFAIDAGCTEGLRVGMWLGAVEPFRSGYYEVVELSEHAGRVRHTEWHTQPPTPVGATLGIGRR